MVKGTELWDDSALIRAFDAAMTSHKEMHTECLNGPALDEEKDDNYNKESDTVLSEEAKSGRQSDSECNNLECNNAAATNVPSTQENDTAVNCSMPEFNPPPISENPCTNPKIEGYSHHQDVNYDELLKQYNELEHRKEKIVEQLWQANYWNYQTPDQCPTSQQQQVSVSGGSELGPNNYCPRCACQCPMASALSVRYACCPQQFLCCSGSQVQQEAAGGHCSINPGNFSWLNSYSMKSMNHLVQADDRAVETGSIPLDLVNNSVKEDLSRVFNLHRETKNGEGDAAGKDLSRTSHKTDLASVTNAWYWAGYYTGRTKQAPGLVPPPPAIAPELRFSLSHYLFFSSSTPSPFLPSPISHRSSPKLEIPHSLPLLSNPRSASHLFAALFAAEVS